MNRTQRAASAIISLALLTSLAACGGGGGGDDNGSTAGSSASSSSSAQGSASSLSSAGSSGAATKTCPDTYAAITYTGGGIPGASLSINSKDGKARLNVTMPSTPVGNYKICIGTPDSSVLPTTGAGIRNYEVIGEGSYAALLNPKLTIFYTQAGNVAVNYLATPSTAGAPYGTYDAANNLVLDRRVATTAVAQDAAFVASVDAVKPGLYMTSEPTP